MQDISPIFSAKYRQQILWIFFGWGNLYFRADSGEQYPDAIGQGVAAEFGDSREASGCHLDVTGKDFKPQPDAKLDVQEVKGNKQDTHHVPESLPAE